MTKTNLFRPAWTPLTIGLMVLGFITFLPLGLAMLGYILFGERLHQMWNEKSGSFEARMRCGSTPATSWTAKTSSGNVAFDEFRAAELARLHEERRKLDAMRDEFDAYQRDLNRARDQEEFDRFLRNRENAKSEITQEKASPTAPSTNQQVSNDQPVSRSTSFGASDVPNGAPA